jgi:thiamine biosynthesis lipoprotein
MNLSSTAYYSSEFGLYHNHCPAMGTRLDVLIHGVEKPEGDKAFERVYGIVTGLDSLLSHFDENSPVSMINRLCSRKAIVAAEEVFNVLILCREYYDRTSGLFDVGIGKATSLLKEGKGDSGRILELLRLSGIENVVLDPDRNSVRFLSEAVEIDLGGFGKGYALERVKSALNRLGISDAFITFGDSSILAFGNHPHGPGWKSGISHLFKTGESLYDFHLKNESLSTSGTVPGNARMDLPAHILHPVRGLLETGYRHISVVSKLATDAEVLSTALLAATEHERTEVLQKFPDCRAVEVKYDDRGNASVRTLNQTHK